MQHYAIANINTSEYLDLKDQRSAHKSMNKMQMREILFLYMVVGYLYISFSNSCSKLGLHQMALLQDGVPKCFWD